MVEGKALGVALVIGLLVLATSCGIYATCNQKTFTLNVSSPSFIIEETQFNDSVSAKEYNFNQSGNVTYWVQVPKNSTILNASMLLTGRIIYVYNRSTDTPGVIGISIGDVAGDAGDEMVIGSTSGADHKLRVLYGNNGSIAWSYNIVPSGSATVLCTAIGNVTNNAGNEIVAGSNNKSIFLLDASDSNATEIWDRDMGGNVLACAIADVNGDGFNEVVGGSSERVVVFNSAGTELWRYEMNANDLEVADINESAGNETIFASGTSIYVLNSSGNLSWSLDLGTINAISVNNVTTAIGVGIAAGLSNGTVYLLNSTGSLIWSYTLDSAVQDITIGDATIEHSGNEIVAGSNNGYIYTFNSTGALLWSFYTATLINTVCVGNLTNDAGNEVAAGEETTGQGSVYTFNFDYFPTNISIDIGGEGTPDWNSTQEKLRESENVSGIQSAINSYLVNNCNAELCNVPLVFRSSGPGKLNISGLNATYLYNLSDRIISTAAATWSRITDVKINESVGNYTINVSYISNSAYTMNVKYIVVNQSASSCDFNRSGRSVATVAGLKVCDVTDFDLASSGSMPAPTLLWDNTMETGVPVLMNESTPWNTSTMNNYYWRKNLTIWNNTGATFYSVEANTSTTDVRGFEYINVSWKGSWCNITPSSYDANCNAASPSYDSKTCSGDVFYACMKDTDSNGAADFFRWKQPYVNGTVNYQTGGSRNLMPVLDNNAVSPASAVWGSQFNLSVDANDSEGDITGITLWVRINTTSAWMSVETKNISGSGTALFNITADETWTGTGAYCFEYLDINTSGAVHSARNASIFTGPAVLKHNTSVNYIAGNATSVIRAGSNYSLLIISVNDSETNQTAGDGINCTFWVTTSGSTFDSGHTNATNSSGYCHYYFDADANYSIGAHVWKAGVYNDAYYENSETEGMNLSIEGSINITLTRPASENATLYRNSTNFLEAVLSDQYNDSVNVSGYNCTFWFNGVEIANTTTGLDGRCNYTWNASCEPLGFFYINVTLSGNASSDYGILLNESGLMVWMKDNLTSGITSPVNFSAYSRGQNITLAAVVNDTCYLCNQSNYTLAWKAELKQRFIVTLSESEGAGRTSGLVSLNGSYLRGLGVDINEWAMNTTHVYCGGVETPSEVIAWTDGTRTAINGTLQYMDDYSELIFISSVPASSSRTCSIYHNRTNPMAHNISVVRNGAFEGGNESPWTFSYSTCTGCCKHRIIREGNEVAGNYSLYMAPTSDGAITAVQTLAKPLMASYIKARYRAWGEYDSGSYVKISAGNGTCTFNLSGEIANASGTWEDVLCYNTSFLNADVIDISIKDVGNGGGEIDVPQVYFDYICPANSTGDCLPLDYNMPLQASVTHDEPVGYVWQLAANESLGLRKITVNASGTHYTSSLSTAYAYVYGWSNISYTNLTSDYCVHGPTGIAACMSNATMILVCRVMDVNNSLPVEGHNASFYVDGALLGYNDTWIDGYGYWLWPFSTDVAGMHNVTCNITSDARVFYYAVPNGRDVMINITSGNTTGEVFFSPYYQNASGITQSTSYSFPLSITLNNTGDGNMYNTNIQITVPAGIAATSVSCGSMTSGTSCTKQSTVTVNALAALGVNNINVTAFWYNDDYTQSNASNQSTVFVLNNTLLRVNEDWINYSIPVGGLKRAGNFTITAFGNTNIAVVNYSISGTDANEVSGWISFEPDGFSDLSRGANQIVYVNLSVPKNATLRNYKVNITANASGSPCSPPSGCWDMVTLNFTVNVQDWALSPSYMNKTIGMSEVNGTIGTVTIANNRDVNYTFSISVKGNGSAYIMPAVPELNVSALESGSVDIYHNASNGFNVSTWYANVSFVNGDGDAVPVEANATVELRVISLDVRILSPNSTNQQGIVNASHTINATLNITLDSAPINESQQIGMSIYIGNQLCTGAYYYHNQITSTWFVNCSAPSIPGNPINNTLKVLVNYIPENMQLQAESAAAVVYDDLSPPQITAISVNSSDSEGNLGNGTDMPEIVIIANLTDNTAVGSVWANVTHPNGSSYTYAMLPYAGNAWIFNFSNPHAIGDYKVIVYANDTVHGYANDTANSTIGYFDIYLPLRLYGIINDTNGTAAPAIFRFYKTGTSWKMHEFQTNSTGHYNWQVHQRSYDIAMSVFGHAVTFREANMTLSAIQQTNGTSNLTTPIRFDSIPNRSVSDIGNIYVPSGVKNAIMAFTVETPHLSHTTKEIAMYYGDAWFSGLVEGRIRLMYCSDWIYENRTCSSTPEFFSTSQGPDETTNTFSFSMSGNTTYILVECTRDDCQPPGTDVIIPGGVTQVTSPGSIPSYSPPPAAITARCGNEICELGENNQNCPADCGASETPFSIKTTVGEDRIYTGTNKTYLLWVTNYMKNAMEVAFSVEGSLREFIRFEKNVIRVAANDTESMKVYVHSSPDITPGTYSGSIVARGGDHREIVPLNLIFARPGELALDVTARIKNPSITIYEPLEIEVNVFNLGTANEVNGTITYEIKSMRTGENVLTVADHISIKTRKTFIKLIQFSGSNIPTGKYVLEVSVSYSGQVNTVSDSFQIVQPIITPENLGLIILGCSGAGIAAAGFYGWKRYRIWKVGKARYIFPLDFRKLPRDSDDNFWIGNVAETDRKAWFNPNDLTTHVLVAGATGSGKSVSASVITEEALKSGVPVIVFDPTAQWTGFVRPCKDENLLRCYTNFGMRKEDARPFKGLIYEVTDPNIRIDFKKYMKPGEVTVFTLNKLKPGEYDVAVMNIIDTIFAVGWEESPELKMIVVFDEVHRLLEKYGGKGGYVALEKACREFRKWGIGLVMASQVSSDFKEAIMGNVLTEIQLNTKSMEDIKKIETKYGKNYSSRITHEGVGVGMVQNPKYNEGKPYFIQFRPTLHQPHKITDEEMEMYKKYTKVMEEFTSKTAAMKAKGVDVTDIMLEIELVKDKLKEGRFRMVEIYVQSLQEKLK